MPPLLPHRRTSSPLTLRVRATDAPHASPSEGEDPLPGGVPWYVAVLGCGAAAAFGSWLVFVGVVVIGWLFSPTVHFGAAWSTGTQLWLLATGGGLQLGGQQWTLAPLTLTLALGWLIAYAARTAFRLVDQHDADGHIGAFGGRAARNTVLLVTGGYVLATTLIAIFAGSAEQVLRSFLASFLLGLVAAAWGAFRAVGYRIGSGWPRWLRAVPVAVRSALLVLLATGAIVLAIGTIRHFGQVSQLTQDVAGGPVGGFWLLLVQLAYLPNLIVWAASWALGAGFRVGVDSVVSPSNTALGLLPPVPVLGALPAEGSGTGWTLLWLLAGVAAGVIAAVRLMQARPRARFDETALVGGLSGVVAGLGFTLLAFLSRGDLGTERLVAMGPRITELAVMATALLGLSGMATGLIWGLVRRPGAEPVTAEGVATDPGNTGPRDARPDATRPGDTRPVETDQSGRDGEGDDPAEIGAATATGSRRGSSVVRRTPRAFPLWDPAVAEEDTEVLGRRPGQEA